MAKLLWRVKLVADLGSVAVSETEVARIERDDLLSRKPSASVWTMASNSRQPSRRRLSVLRPL